MKKIVLGCAAVLLSLGLLAGCNNEEKKVEPGPEENPNGDDDGGETEAKLFKLAAYDYSDATWRYALGTNDETTGMPATTETWESAPWISAVELSTGGYALGLGEEASSFLSWGGAETTTVAWGSESYAWTWDKDLGTFTVADTTLKTEQYRYLGMNVTNHDIRAFGGSNLTDSDAYPVALAVGSKPTSAPADDRPEPVSEIKEGTYNLGLVFKSVTNYFNGEVQSSFYLDVSTDINDAVAVKVAHPSGSEDGWTLSFELKGEGDQTTTEYLYAYSEWDSERGYTHQTLLFAAEGSIPTTEESNILAVTTVFTWDADICGFTAQLAKYEDEDGAEKSTGQTESVTVTMGTTSYAEITVTTSSSVIPAHLYEIETEAEAE